MPKSEIYFLLKIGHLCQIVNRAMTNNYEKLGSIVRKLRKEKGFSQEAFAELIGRDARTVVAIETGKRNPTLKTLNKIAKVLNVSLSNLFE